ncbi:MAG: ABC transporter ATP-binding protein [Parasporobacterium sp.]|nr:ABC transporter ATP-binding protein [Parasporobacterium sp.]
MNALRVENLHVCFQTQKGKKIAVDGVSFSVKPGEIFGLVGESGCGKSVTSMSILKLITPPGRITEGIVEVDGENILELSENQMQKRIRGSRISMIFQEPMTSLNPLITIGEQISETLRVHKNLSRKEAKEEAIRQLNNVGIPMAEKHYNSYPHALSGGMRQRVMIAIAMACEPEILIADEPTTALDVTVQAQILSLMKRASIETGVAIVLITHDLGVIANMCDRVAVMYCGKIVEEGITEDVLKNPHHPYTRGLIASIPRLTGEEKMLHSIPNTVPQIYEGAKGCYFSNRCDYCMEKCTVYTPRLKVISDQHRVACHLYGGDAP